MINVISAASTNVRGSLRRWFRLAAIVSIVSVMQVGGAAQTGDQATAPGRIEIGNPSGVHVYLSSTVRGKWGLEIVAAGAHLAAPAPLVINLHPGAGTTEVLVAPYSSVKRATDGSVLATGTVRGAKGGSSGAPSFAFEDTWKVADGVLHLVRKVAVHGSAPGGFYSAFYLSTAQSVSWSSLHFLAPGLLYGDPTYDGESSPGGVLNNQAHRFWMREDFLPSPLFAAAFDQGFSMTMLNPAPRAATTLQETKSDPGPPMTDARFSFGAFGAEEASNGKIEIGYRFPGSVPEYKSVPNEKPIASERPRANPIEEGFSQSYQIAFRFGRNESFPEMSKNDIRWSWQVLHPTLTPIDVELTRRVLIDQLASRVVTINGFTGIPFIESTKTGEVWTDPRDPDWWWRAIMGFVGKNVEAANQLLIEGDRDASPRGQHMRQLGLDIITTFIKKCPMSPPAGTGFNLRSGKPSMTNPQYNTWFLRAPTDDMRMLMEAWERERGKGRDHPEWIAWCKSFADWLLTQQREDGSFPRGWRPGTGEVAESSGTTSYNVVPLFLLLSRDTGNQDYYKSALRAAEYTWQNFGAKGVFVGGAIDNPNITDKEAGLLSLEAFLALYESTHDTKWLARSQAAADFAESWIWLWNVPMPVDAPDEELQWKREVPTTGLQGITAAVAGHVDEFLDWSVPAYARLYTYTKDPHYLEVARLLLHNTKGMLAMPNQTFGMVGPGWQTENWRMGPSPHTGRGFGTPEKWMPWITVNHLVSITGLDSNPELFRELTPRGPR